jgi:hypothetical protein
MLEEPSTVSEVKPMNAPTTTTVDVAQTQDADPIFDLEIQSKDKDDETMMAYSTTGMPNLSEEMSVAETEKDENKVLEFVGLGAWIASLSTFLLVNNFVGPFPGEWLQNTPVEYFGLTHAIAGMLFGGGVILTTLIEWLAVGSKNTSVLNFWFGNVPALDSMIVLPALTASIVSGVGLSVDHYNSLGEAPVHVVSAISTLLAFAIWWASTDLTTQGAASEAIEEWTKDGGESDVPRIIQLRKISNVVSCAFVAAIYAIMVLKPGYNP